MNWPNTAFKQFGDPAVRPGLRLTVLCTSPFLCKNSKNPIKHFICWSLQFRTSPCAIAGMAGQLLALRSTCGPANPAQPWPGQGQAQQPRPDLTAGLVLDCAREMRDHQLLLPSSRQNLIRPKRLLPSKEKQTPK